MAESKVVIAPDNASGGAHSVRTETATPLNTGVAVEQQVVTLGDPTGNLINAVDGSKLPTFDEMTHTLLKALILRLDILNAAVDRNYSPPDELYEEVR